MTCVRPHVWALLSLAWLGCGPVLPDDATDGSGDGDGGTAADTGTATMGTSAGTAMTSTTTAGTTGVPSGCAGDVFVGCQSACAATITCDPASGIYEECVTECNNALGTVAPECQLQLCEAYACVGALDCATIETGSEACQALLLQANETCGFADDCTVEVGADGCAHTCTGAVDRELVCRGDTCTCYEKGEVIATCTDEGVCGALDDLDAYEAACCGW